MRQVNSFLIAFSMYSRIPVPQPDWEHSSMDYVMCYFPFVGTVLGALAWLCFLTHSKTAQERVIPGLSFVHVTR